MENWGGVAGFRVLLRRREDVRVFGGRSISASRVRKKKKKKKNQGRLNQKEKLRKKPTIPASPVPGWLRAETDERAVRSFDEIRAIVNRLKMGFEGQRDGVRSEEGGEEVMHRFPDIEILPVFKDA